MMYRTDRGRMFEKKLQRVIAFCDELNLSSEAVKGRKGPRFQGREIDKYSGSFQPERRQEQKQIWVEYNYLTFQSTQFDSLWNTHSDEGLHLESSNMYSL